MQRVLVTGADGQLGKCLQRRVVDEGNKNIFIFAHKQHLDISKKNKVFSFCSENEIDLIINTAAYTSVDKAEKEPEKAEEINVKSVQNLVDICKEFSIKLLHISTDYVFDGKSNIPYIETDFPNPINVYGKTKYKAEQIILKSEINAVIIRTSWVFSEYGSNFLKTITELAETKSELTVVADQIGKPTYAYDLAKILLQILSNFPLGNALYHFANGNECSWYQFATEIINKLNSSCNIKPIKTSEYTTLAKRPMYSVLNTDKIESDFNFTGRFWQNALSECINRMKLNDRLKV